MNRQMRNFIFPHLPVFFLLLLSACESNSKPQEKDTTVIAGAASKDTVYFDHTDTILIPDSVKDAIVFPDKALSKWVSFYKKRYANFDPHAFKAGTKHRFSFDQAQPFTSPATHDDSLAQLLYCWSPDKNYIVDIYSVRYFFVEHNGKTTLEGGDPESGIRLTSIKKKTTWLIAYTGSTQSYEDVAWLDSTRIIVAGNMETDNGSLQPYYTVYNVITRETTWFMGPIVPPRKGKSYLCTKFPEYCAE